MEERTMFPSLKSVSPRSRAGRSRVPRLEQLELRDLPNSLFSLLGSLFADPALDLKDFSTEIGRQADLPSLVPPPAESQLPTAPSALSLGKAGAGNTAPSGDASLSTMNHASNGANALSVNGAALTSSDDPFALPDLSRSAPRSLASTTASSSAVLTDAASAGLLGGQRDGPVTSTSFAPAASASSWELFGGMDGRFMGWARRLGAAHGQAPSPLGSEGGTAGSQPITGLTRQVSLAGTTSFPTRNTGSGTSGGASPLLVKGFDGLNAFQQRYANGGNQFNIEPPDEGLAVGNGYVVNVVNTVIRVYNTSGTPLTDVMDLNTFFGYPAQLNRATGEQGPSITDPSAYFDQPTQRWFVDEITLDVNPNTGDLTGPNRIDLAVSKTADPTGAWNIYRLPTQNDGTEGTPDHGGGLTDFPHIGADANGIYITTNEFRFSDFSFRGAQVYAFSKQALAMGAASVPVVQFDTAANPAGNPDGQPGFTLIPASTPGSGYASGQGGTEYLLSSTNLYTTSTGTGNLLEIWALTNTKSLNSASPSLTLQSSGITVNTFGFPPAADQKSGVYPFGLSLSNPNFVSTYFPSFTPSHQVEESLDSIDTRMTQVTYVNGQLWGALDTAVNVGSATKAGIDWYVLTPQVNGTGVTGSVLNQGTLALAGNNLIVPALAVTPSGRGVISFSVAGRNYYPSAGYAPINAISGAGAIQIAAEGQAPEDGFTGYTVFFGSNVARWGDYSAAAVDGSTVWVASEYIGNSGSVGAYMKDPTLGGTRTLIANWDNRITPVST
jgi:hypothetical protein